MIAWRNRWHAELRLPDLADACQQRVVGGRRNALFCRIKAREYGVAVQAAILQAQAAGRALQLAAGSLGQGAGIEQHHHLWRLLVSLGHGLADRVDQLAGGHRLLHATANLGRDADALLAVDLDREGRDPPLAHRCHLGFHRALDVLRVEVVATDDQHVLQTAGDVQLTPSDETQVARAQPGTASALDEGLGRGLGITPVALGDARPGGPDFADAVILQHLAAGRVNDRYRMFGLAAATAHQHAVRAAGNLVARQCLAIHWQRADALPPLAARDEQGRLGQAVAGEETRRLETAGGELLSEVLQAVLTDRFGTGIRDAPTTQIKIGQRRLGHSLAAQTVGEIRPAADGAAITADRLQPAQRTSQEILRGHQHARDAAENRLQQPADQPHVVIQR